MNRWAGDHCYQLRPNLNDWVWLADRHLHIVNKVLPCSPVNVVKLLQHHKQIPVYSVLFWIIYLCCGLCFACVLRRSHTQLSVSTVNVLSREVRIVIGLPLSLSLSLLLLQMHSMWSHRIWALSVSITCCGGAQLNLELQSIPATWMCRSVYAIADCILHPATMCWIISGPSLHCLHRGSYLVHYSPASNDLA